MKHAIASLERICTTTLARPELRRGTRLTVAAVFPLFAELQRLERENAELRARLGARAHQDHVVCRCIDCTIPDTERVA